MKVGNRIKEIRNEFKISQYKLAKLTKTLNQSQISKIENGKRELKVEDLISISKALKIPVNELIKKEEQYETLNN
ncbi:MAG: helix-turn-helix transcriptional regulator [Clostridium botulinum]|uniref:helix-turn-helix domain-containing protein n=1 Tax=Clostridium sporogenes TaxID=1509 RepID=UPI001C60F438|nr:helix-turn-helix transcriptional regulator [Clostridium sporogenes]MBW5456572.1 helix-turn-helix domain-containing protein [Clostridium sporogenes]MDU2834258.1 helix-turn-helix transcriptional regulator [Clostridium botulinum]